MAMKPTDYKPLIAVIIAILLGSASIAQAHPEMFLHHFMSAFMGLFFLIFSLFKLINIEGFADGFQKYDLLAKRTRFYAYLYPFLELGLGLLYLSEYCPLATNIGTLILMTVSAAGVILSIKRGYKFRCACLGTVLDAPLSTITIIENAGMGLMAVGMLLSLS